ncbi:4'-phosphopantetheinyl transferase [Streptomyces filamentosus]|uniref:4'-phosphopantetheinyl transferase n=1 Tax=Streptomyces filamentosus TaxID=67294 RepID=A0A919EH41_STRFL|nr:4'-phosphopantetheinyl transferase superfamily protein [Streptomyces filamentosus]GHF79135.1 4'-phosphopantetheinyl transferase [Streptomyces filamentosus]
MIEELLPAGVAGAERFDDAEAVTPFPEEEAVVARSVAERRDSFHTARLCARLALAELGLPPVPILPGPKGEPRWPAGLVGSMTHCTGYRGAVLARASEFAGLGIDAEPHLPLPEGVLETVSLPAERERLLLLGRDHPGVHWDRLLFSAKEAVYKVWFPLARKWLDFDEADIALLPDGRFTARLLVPGPVVAGRRVPVLAGRWRVGRGLVLTALVLGPAGESLTGPGHVRDLP